MLKQPAAERMRYRQATADSLLKAQPHSPKQAANGTYTDLGAAAGLTVIFLAVFDADGLELVNLVLENLQGSRNKRHECSSLVALEDHPRVTQPTDVFDSEVGDESVFVIARAGNLMTEDVLAGVAANDQAEHDLSTFACCLHFGVVGVRQV